jgi:hypothetical protein
MKKAIIVFVLFFYFGCRSDHGVEKYQHKRNNTTNVHDRIKKIEIDDILISPLNQLYVTKDHLLISDFNSLDKQIHLFNKDDFSHVTSVAPKGQGPGEIANMGQTAIDDVNNIFFVSDHGKQKIFGYELDSVICNPHYMPEVKMTMNQAFFPSRYWYINDSLSIGIIIEPIGNSDYSKHVAKLNLNTGEIKKMKYEHPDIRKKRIRCAVSVEHKIYVECYSHHDLITVCSLDGDLKYNIYGQYWSDKTSNRFNYFGEVVFCNDRIFALYSEGSDSRSNNRYPTKFLVFNLSGDYIQTLETEYQITTFCYDQENNRLILSMDADLQFGYLDLNRMNID